MEPKITSLSPEQIAAMPRYVALGIEIGLAVDSPKFVFPEDKVRELTDRHRQKCGVAKAENFIVLDSPFAAMKDPRFKGLSASNALYGQHDINWLIYYAFFRVECGLVEETEQIVELLELSKLTGWMWMSSNTTIVTRRPVEIHLLAKAEGPKVLHNTTGYALKYRDGTGICVVNGIRIPEDLEHLILDRKMKDEARCKAILKIKNTEIRGALLRTLDPGVLAKSLKTTTVHEDSVENGGDYKLVELSIEGSARRYLTGVCPSKGDTWFEAVPPTCNTVRQALSWREWGQVEIPYIAPLVRT